MFYLANSLNLAYLTSLGQFWILDALIVNFKKPNQFEIAGVVFFKSRFLIESDMRHAFVATEFSPYMQLQKKMKTRKSCKET